MAAINMYFHNLGYHSPAQDRDIERLVTALVKRGTKKPMNRQKPMPIDAFLRLFESMGDREYCSKSKDIQCKRRIAPECNYVFT